MCVFRFPFWWKLLGQNLHLYDFSMLEWVFRWTSKCFFEENPLLHTAHLKSLLAHFEAQFDPNFYFNLNFDFKTGDKNSIINNNLTIYEANDVFQPSAKNILTHALADKIQKIFGKYCSPQLKGESCTLKLVYTPPHSLPNIPPPTTLTFRALPNHLGGWNFQGNLNLT